MDTTSDQIRPDGRRTGAAWVAATGAFLLLAAAATFVAVRWDQIPDVVKLAVVATATGSALLAGRSLRTTLPATSGVVFHLGAFLVPVDVAAVAVHIGVDWRGMLLAQGLIGTTTFAGLAVVQRSVVLAWAAAAASVVLAAGLAGPLGVPTAAVVAVLAVVAHLVADRMSAREGLAARLGASAVALATVAGTAPLLRLIEAVIIPGRPVLLELGLAGASSGRFAAVSGGLAALVLAGRASRNQDLRIGLLALLSVGVGLTATWLEVSPGTVATWLGLAAGFLALQLLAWAVAADPFWSRPTAVLAQLTEGAAGLAMTPLAIAVLVLPWVPPASVFGGDHLGIAGTAALLAAGWLTADLRRGGGWVPAAPVVAITVAAAAAAASLSATLAGAVLVAVAALTVVGRRPFGAGLAAFTAVWAPSLAADEPLASIALGLGGALVAALATVRRVPAPGRWIDASHWLLVSTATAAVAVVPLGHADFGQWWGFVVAALGLWATAAVLDGAVRTLGHLPRITALLLVVPAVGLTHAGTALVAAVVALLSAVEAARHDEPRLALGGALLCPIALGSWALAAGLATADAGLALCVAAAAWLGLAALADIDGSGARRWAPSLGAASVATAVGGLAMAAADAARLAEGLLLVGAVVATAGATRRLPTVAHAGGALAILGLWGNLAVAEVGTSEAYLAPVGVQLLVAGMVARRRASVGTLAAYGPAITLLGAPGLIERLAGGGGGHALGTGVVGIVAVVVGGRFRLAGPLLVGTALLVAVVGAESMVRSIAVPTWAWLATGGTFLLTVGIGMDRMATGPVEAGRRMVDVVRERFE